MKNLLRDIGVTLALALAIFLPLQTTFQSFVVIGCSMEPSFEDGERLLVNKIARELDRGDVIIFKPPNHPNVEYIKRVIALPGDSVKIQNGVVYINGVKLDEPYIKEPPHYTMPQKIIPTANYFVLGDNRNNSIDSHKGWTVPSQNVIGKAWLRIWPPGEWGTVTHYPLEKQLVS